MDVLFDDFAAAAFLISAFLKYGRPYRAHLRAVFWAHNCRHQVSAEGGAGPGDIACLFVNVNGCAVSRKPGLQAAGHARAHVAPVVGGSDHQCFRLIFFYQGDQRLGECVCGIVFILWPIYYNGRIRAVADGVLGYPFNLLANYDSHQGAPFLFCQWLCHVQQLIADIFGLSAFCLNEYPYILIIIQIAHYRFLLIKVLLLPSALRLPWPRQRLPCLSA
jgi:hypothetical protein